MIYFPQRYSTYVARSIPSWIERLPYETSAGRQTAFYIAPRSGAERPPDQLWVFFGGNGAVALGWLNYFRFSAMPEPSAGYLLIDYPGFGLCEGSPGLKRIQESSEAALQALAAHLGVRTSYFNGRLNLLGHSLGAAAALQLAEMHPARRIVLLSPFTSMVDMAHRYVGWPLCNFVPEPYDNRARLGELARQQPRPQVVILHGDRDAIVPVWMGRELADLHRNWIEYLEIKGADHDSFLTDDIASIIQAMFPEDRLTAMRD